MEQWKFGSLFATLLLIDMIIQCDVASLQYVQKYSVSPVYDFDNQKEIEPISL